MPFTRLENKHTYLNAEQEVQVHWNQLRAYHLEPSSSSYNDDVFCRPLYFTPLYPEQGDEIDERSGRKINARNIKLMIKTEIPKQTSIAGHVYPNPLYYLTKGIHSTIKHTSTVTSSGTGSRQNISGSVNGTTLSTSGAGTFTSSNIDMDTSIQNISLTTPITTFTTFDMPAYKFKIKLRVLIVQAAPDYFDQDGFFSHHKVLEWFVKNRVYVGENPENPTTHEIKLYSYSNTDQILRESSDYTGQYSIKYDKIITHTVGSDEMLTFDIPLNQELTFDEKTSNVPSNKKHYHILIIPPLTNKGLTGPYGYEKLPDLVYDNGTQSSEINAITDLNKSVSPTNDGHSYFGEFKVLSNVKFFYLDF